MASPHGEWPHMPLPPDVQVIDHGDGTSTILKRQQTQSSALVPFVDHATFDNPDPSFSEPWHWSPQNHGMKEEHERSRVVKTSKLRKLGVFSVKAAVVVVVASGSYDFANGNQDSSLIPDVVEDVQTFAQNPAEAVGKTAFNLASKLNIPYVPGL